MSNETGDRPNFVFIISDQHRRDTLGCYGSSVCRTPSLDRLAADGVLFENAFGVNVVCSPSRATLITGRYPRTHGVIINGIPLPRTEITLPQVLAEAGYRTAAVGHLDLEPHDLGENFPGRPAGYVSPESYAWQRAGKPMPVPYHGFQHVVPRIGFPDDVAQHYRDLMAIDPKLPELWLQKNALEPPSGAPSSWKSGMPEAHSSSVWLADKAIGCLENFARDNVPFFLHVGFPDPHFPFAPVAPWCHMYDPADVPMPHRSRDEVTTTCQDYCRRLDRFAKAWPYHPLDMPEAHMREIIAHYYGMVSQLDHNIGRILTRLDELGLGDNTVVVFLPDHGEHLGDHWLMYKCCVLDELCHLPMIWRWRGKFPAGQRVAGMVSYVDVMPTFLSLAGVPVPRGVQGGPFTPALNGETFAGRDAVLLENDLENNRSWVRTIRTPRHHMNLYEPAGDGELYDLEEDPHELVNRWADRSFSEIRGHLSEEMVKLMLRAADPKPRRVAYC